MSQLSKETLLGGLDAEPLPRASSTEPRTASPSSPMGSERPGNSAGETQALPSECLASGAEDAALRDTRSWEKSRASSESLVGTMVGSYKVTRLLGEGSVGAVYLGEHPLVGARVAIKILHDDIAQSKGVISRFLTEARAANQIPSRHIVPVTDFGKLPDGRDYAVMEYLDGQSLEAVLGSEGRIAPRRVAAILCQVAEAMAEAHARGIIHRDLKPENLFLQRDSAGQEFVRILDFGIAKLVHEPPSDARGTAVGAFLGTPLYCSPEQAVGHAIGPATDIYAIGAIAYEMLTGQPLFEANNVVEMLLLKASRSITSLDKLPVGVPQELATLILQCLARSPENRPESMAVLAERLRQVVGQTVTKGPDSALIGVVPERPTPREDQVAHPPPNPVRCSEAAHTMLPVTRSDVTGLQIVGERRRRAPVVVAVGAAAITVMAVVGWLSLRPNASQAAASLQASVGSAPASEPSAGEMLPPAVVAVAASSEPPMSPSAQAATADSVSAPAAPARKSVSSSGSRNAPAASTTLSPMNATATAKEKRPPAKKPTNLVDPFN